jgi:glycosyltransferase involved in cell wall biosynthesis
MAVGKLVVVTDGPGVRDYVEDCVTGLVVPPADASALADALSWCLDSVHADEHRAMRARARETALRRFSPDAYFERLREVVEATLE